jgi:hypothetical protein
VAHPSPSNRWQGEITTLAPAGSVNAVNVRLCRLACDIDEAIDQLEGWHLTDGEAELLGLPIMHLAIALRRLEQIVYEVQKLDQRPRLEKLRAAA